MLFLGCIGFRKIHAVGRFVLIGKVEYNVHISLMYEKFHVSFFIRLMSVVAEIQNILIKVV